MKARPLGSMQPLLASPPSPQVHRLHEWTLSRRTGCAVAPRSSNSVPIAPIGPILTRACVPVCVRRCDRGRCATRQRRRPDATGSHGRRRRRRPQPLRRPLRLSKRGARAHEKIEPTDPVSSGIGRDPAAPTPRLPPRHTSPVPAPSLTHATPLVSRLQLWTPLPTRSVVAEITAGGGARQRRQGRYGARQPPCARADRWRGRPCVQQRAWRARSAWGRARSPRTGQNLASRRPREQCSSRDLPRREIAAVRSLRRLRGGSRRSGAVLVVACGCTEAGWQVGGGLGGPWWSFACVTAYICHVSNGGDTIEIASPVGVMGVGPSVFPRALQLCGVVWSAKNRTSKGLWRHRTRL